MRLERFEITKVLDETGSELFFFRISALDSQNRSFLWIWSSSKIGLVQFKNHGIKDGILPKITNSTENFRVFFATQTWILHAILSFPKESFHFSTSFRQTLTTFRRKLHVNLGNWSLYSEWVKKETPKVRFHYSFHFILEYDFNNINFFLLIAKQPQNLLYFNIYYVIILIITKLFYIIQIW